MAINRFAVSYQKWFDIEIDAKQNEQLLKDTTTKFNTNSFSSRRVEKNVCHGYEVGNLYRTIRVFKWFFIFNFRWLQKYLYPIIK